MFHSIKRPCVFCQLKQTWIPFIICQKCKNYISMDNQDGEDVILCNLEGSVIDGQFIPAKNT